MTETELLTFINNPSNKENETLEYKLKPNFNEIESSIKAITNRMHFNILKTIYAFANTEGGELYIGVTDEKHIEGIDEPDKNIVTEKIWEKVDQSIKKEKEIIKLKNGRVVIKIKVFSLKIYDKPLFVDGVLYVRENNRTKKVSSFKNYLSLYEDRQLYMCYVRGIENNLKKLAEQNDFEVQQFIKGLKAHIKSFIEQNRITGYENTLSEAEDLLDTIGQKTVDSENQSTDTLPDIPSDLDSLIDKFIGIYKNIISKG